MKGGHYTEKMLEPENPTMQFSPASSPLLEGFLSPVEVSLNNDFVCYLPGNCPLGCMEGIIFRTSLLSHALGLKWNGRS